MPYKDIEFPILYKKIMSIHFQDIRVENWAPSEDEKFLKVYGFCWLYGTNKVYREVISVEKMRDIINFVYISVGF